MTTNRRPSALTTLPVTLGALALLLGAASAAHAQLAGGQVANDVCKVESTRANQLRDALIAAADSAGYTGGLSEKECANFVNEQVKNCIALIHGKCRTTLDKTELQIQNAQCRQDNGDNNRARKSCEHTAAQTQINNDRVADTLDIIGGNICKGTFKTAIANLCTNGPPP